MRAIPTDIIWSVCLFVSLLDTTVSREKTAEAIEMLFETLTHRCLRNRVLDGGPDPFTEGTLLGRDMYRTPF